MERYGAGGTSGSGIGSRSPRPERQTRSGRPTSNSSLRSSRSSDASGASAATPPTSKEKAAKLEQCLYGEGGMTAYALSVTKSAAARTAILEAAAARQRRASLEDGSLSGLSLERAVSDELNGSDDGSSQHHSQPLVYNASEIGSLSKPTQKIEHNRKVRTAEMLDAVDQLEQTISLMGGGIGLEDRWSAREQTSSTPEATNSTNGTAATPNGNATATTSDSSSPDGDSFPVSPTGSPQMKTTTSPSRLEQAAAAAPSKPTHVVDVQELRRLASQGIPERASHRAVTWRILLGYLPPETAKWEEVLKRDRGLYRNLVSELFVQPSHDGRQVNIAESEGRHLRGRGMAKDGVSVRDLSTLGLGGGVAGGGRAATTATAGIANQTRGGDPPGKDEQSQKTEGDGERGQGQGEGEAERPRMTEAFRQSTRFMMSSLLELPEDGGGASAAVAYAAEDVDAAAPTDPLDAASSLPVDAPRSNSFSFRDSDRAAEPVAPTPLPGESEADRSLSKRASSRARTMFSKAGHAVAPPGSATPGGTMSVDEYRSSLLSKARQNERIGGGNGGDCEDVVPARIREQWRKSGRDTASLADLSGLVGSTSHMNALLVSGGPGGASQPSPRNAGSYGVGLGGGGRRGGTQAPRKERVTVDDDPLSLESDSNWAQFFENASLLDEIRKDVVRTHPDLHFFLEPEENLGQRRYAALERILFVWAKLNKGVRYVQGMNEIVGTIYFVMANDSNEEWACEAEADTYFLFNTLMVEMRDVFVPDLDDADTGIQGRISNMIALLSLHDPEARCHLDDCGIDASFYSIRWLTTLLSREFALPDTIRLWDSMFASTHKDNFLRYVCVTMVMIIREELLRGEFGACLRLLQSYPSTDVERLLEASRALWIYESQVTLACHKGGISLQQALATIAPPPAIVMAYGLVDGLSYERREKMRMANGGGGGGGHSSSRSTSGGMSNHRGVAVRSGEISSRNNARAAGGSSGGGGGRTFLGNARELWGEWTKTQSNGR